MSEGAEPPRGGYSDAMAPLRWSLIGLAGLGIVGTIAELLFERHWDGLEQLIPWPFLALATAALTLLVVSPRRSTIRLVRVIALLIILAVPVGIWRHANANYNAGFLDFRYADTWGHMSGIDRWLRALTKTVGPAPILAPAVLGQIALCLLAATIRHPAVTKRAP